MGLNHWKPSEAKNKRGTATRPNQTGSGPLILEPLRMVDGDYDEGGAYWGASPTSSVFCAHNEESEIYVRAANWTEAKRLVAQKTGGRKITKPANYLPDFPELDDFEKGYFTCLFWQADEQAGSGEYPESTAAYHFRRLDPEDLRTQLQDCREFRRLAKKELQAARRREGYNLTRAGIDFALSRNHAGSGFWDREELEPRSQKWEELKKTSRSEGLTPIEALHRKTLRKTSLGERLNRIAKTFREVNTFLEEETAHVV